MRSSVQGLTEKILEATRLEADSTGAYYILDGKPTGGSCKNVVYFIKVLQQSASPAPNLQLDLKHGPDGNVSCTHSTPIASTLAPGANEILGGATNVDSTGGQLGEWLHPAVVITSSTAGSSWATIEVFALRKPF